jgi:hypothetical protein
MITSKSNVNRWFRRQSASFFAVNFNAFFKDTFVCNVPSAYLYHGARRLQPDYGA